MIDPREVRGGRPAPASGLHPGTVAIHNDVDDRDKPGHDDASGLESAHMGAGPAMTQTSKLFAKPFQI